jgi:hypothetical protein
MSYLQIHQKAESSVAFSTTLDPIFLPLPEHQDYEISTAGIVRNRKTGHVLKSRIQKSSCRYYVHCHIGRIHRLLMSALSARPLARDELVRHRNGNTFDNEPVNLKVGSAQSNALDKIDSNTNGHRLRNSQVREIRRLAQTRTRREIGALFNISADHVGKIITRKRWNNLP